MTDSSRNETEHFVKNISKNIHHYGGAAMHQNSCFDANQMM